MSETIHFRQRTPLERVMRLFPFWRRQQDAHLRAAIKEIVDNPSLPCSIEGIFIPNGYGLIIERQELQWPSPTTKNAI